MRTTQFEHNKSAYPPITDIRADIVDGSEVPIPDMPLKAFSLKYAKAPQRQTPSGAHPEATPPQSAGLLRLFARIVGRINEGDVGWTNEVDLRDHLLALRPSMMHVPCR